MATTNYTIDQIEQVESEKYGLSQQQIAEYIQITINLYGEDATIDDLEKTIEISQGASVDYEPNESVFAKFLDLEFTQQYSIYKLSDAVAQSIVEKNVIENEFNAYSKMVNNTEEIVANSALRKTLKDYKGNNIALCRTTFKHDCSTLCIKWQNKVYGVEGPTKKFPWIQDAIWGYGGGIFHRGCRHEIVPYNRGDVGALKEEYKKSPITTRELRKLRNNYKYYERNYKKWQDRYKRADYYDEQLEYYKQKTKQWKKQAQQAKKEYNKAKKKAVQDKQSTTTNL